MFFFIQDLLLSSILILQTLAKQPPLSPRLVTTQQGMYRGVLLSPTFPSDAPSCQGCSKLSDHGQKKYSVDAYYGIQYASLLGSKLRFMPPTSSIEKWSGVRLAITHRPVCPQIRRSDEDHGHLDDEDDYYDGGLAVSDPDDDNDERMDGGKAHKMEELKRFAFLRNSSLDDEGLIKFSEVREISMEGYLEKQSEECLFLNVYTPYSTDADNSSLLPVVVFVHGDSYDSGTGNAYDGSFLSAFGGLVVVTLNYRLGVLGFLSTEDANAQGNYALLDLTAALYWIRSNIGGFQGNKDSVTLIGAKYGASLVNILMLSPVTRGQNLIHKSILLGGSALCPDCVINGEDARHSAFHHFQRLAAILNCTEVTSDGHKSINRRRDENEKKAPKPFLGADDKHKSRIGRSRRLDSTLHCLRQTPVERILWASRQMALQDSRPVFGPSIDRRKASILPQDVSSLMREARHPRHSKRWKGRNPLSESTVSLAPGDENRKRRKRRNDMNSNAERIFSPGEEDTFAGNQFPPKHFLDEQSSPNSSSWFSSVPLMVGVDMWEGLKEVRRAEVQSGLTQDQLNKKIRKLIDRKFNRHHQYLHDLVLHQYTDWSSTAPSTNHGNLRTLVDVISDFQVTSSAVEVVRVHSEFGGRSHLFA